MSDVYADVESCVDATIEHVGRQIRLGTPLGIGKANHLVNEFFRRARDDRRIDLRIFTALTLGRPRWKSDLERRFVEPLGERLFGGYPELEYAEPLRRGTLPSNIRVHEFYFQPGSFLESPLAQQQYVSSNYSHAARDTLDAGLNVLAQLVAKRDGDLSLSCNPDLTLDLAPQLREAQRRGARVALLAQVNRNLPFMYGDAVVPPGFFDAIVDAPRYDFPLFAPPNVAVSMADYVIALHVSALIRDGGTFQLGIGSLGDAVTHLLTMRHEQNASYRELLDAAGVLDRFGDVVERVGGTAPFDEGLYAATEMLVHGFLELYRSGILKRAVAGGYIAHACFFLGPESFYEALRQMDRSELEQFCMTSISYVNQLYGDEERKRRERKEARFVNTALVVTLWGAVASDGLGDGRVVSGVGGQYNFVSMAQELDDGRSILLVRSTHEDGGKTRSNIRASYGNTTIPRHLRDIVVTEYGIADIRGRSDEEVAMALIQIADSRFQDELVRDAKRSAKLSRTYRIPDQFRNNHPARLESVLKPFQLPPFPFGTDLTPEEVVLAKALRALKRMVARKRFPLRPLHHVATVPETARPYLERMELAEPRTLKERLLQRAVVYALASVGAI